MSNIFSKAKDMYKMQAEARAMQKKMQEIIVIGYSKNKFVEVKLNGTNEMVGIEISTEILSPSQKNDLEKSIKQALKDANDKLQKELVKNMDINQMKSMLGI